MAWEVHAPKTFPSPKDDTPDVQHRYAWNPREQRAVPIAIENPPPKPQLVETNHYVPYETSSFRQAYTWATEQVARKLPAAVETLRMLDSLIDQQLNAMRNSKSE